MVVSNSLHDELEKLDTGTAMQKPPFLTRFPMLSESMNATACKIEPCGLVFEGFITQDNWFELGRLLVGLKDSVHWMIGDWLIYGMEQFNLTYKQAESLLQCHNITFSYQTLRNDKYLASRIPLSYRNEKLSWQHHKEVASLDYEHQKYWLSLAEEKRLSTKELRNAIKDTKHSNWVCYSDVWNFRMCDARYGVENDDRIPGQIIQNLLFRYTEASDFIIDPTARDGTTLDVCSKCSEITRECLAIDIDPIHPGVQKADAGRPWPVSKKADLVFINATSNFVFDTEQLYLRKILGNSVFHLNDDGILSILIDPRMQMELYGDLTFQVYHYLVHEIGLEYVRRFVVLMPTKNKEFEYIPNTRSNISTVSEIRDLLVFRKKVLKKAPSNGENKKLNYSFLRCAYCGIVIGPKHVETRAYKCNGKEVCSNCLRKLNNKALYSKSCVTANIN